MTNTQQFEDENDNRIRLTARVLLLDFSEREARRDGEPSIRNMVRLYLHLLKKELLVRTTVKEIDREREQAAEVPVTQAERRTHVAA